MNSQTVDKGAFSKKKESTKTHWTADGWTILGTKGFTNVGILKNLLPPNRLPLTKNSRCLKTWDSLKKFAGKCFDCSGKPSNWGRDWSVIRNPKSRTIKSKIPNILGGWTNPVEKYATVKMDHFPNFWEWIVKLLWNHHLANCVSRPFHPSHSGLSSQTARCSNVGWATTVVAVAISKATQDFTGFATTTATTSGNKAKLERGCFNQWLIDGLGPGGFGF